MCMGLIDWSREYNVKNVRKRFLQISRGIVEECKRRISNMKSYRWLYEESPQYEVGYVFGEIVERYRKLVEVIRHNRLKKESFFHSLFHLETAQHLYLEVYHLVMMLHEIPRKYAEQLEFQDLKIYQTDKITAENQLTPEEQQKRYQDLLEYEKEQKRLKKKMAKIMARAESLSQLQTSVASGEARPRKPPNPTWPLDYGWEIDPQSWLHG